MIKKILILLIVFIFAFTISFFVRKLYDSNTTRIEFKNNVHNFGDVKYLDEVKYNFIYKNNGNTVLKIDSTITSCGCTVVKNDMNIIKPNEKDSLLIILSTDVLGYFTKEIVVYSNSIDSPNHLYIKGNIIK